MWYTNGLWFTMVNHRYTKVKKLKTIGTVWHTSDRTLLYRTAPCGTVLVPYRTVQNFIYRFILMHYDLNRFILMHHDLNRFILMHHDLNRFINKAPHQWCIDYCVPASMMHRLSSPCINDASIFYVRINDASIISRPHHWCIDYLPPASMMHR